MNHTSGRRSFLSSFSRSSRTNVFSDRTWARLKRLCQSSLEPFDDLNRFHRETRLATRKCKPDPPRSNRASSLCSHGHVRDSFGMAPSSSKIALGWLLIANHRVDASFTPTLGKYIIFFCKLCCPNRPKRCNSHSFCISILSGLRDAFLSPLQLKFFLPWSDKILIRNDAIVN